MKQFWHENKGSISTLAILSIVGVLMIMFLSINIGNIYAKKNLVEDTADAIAPILLANQITRTIPPTSGILPTTTQNALDTAQDILDNTGDNSLSGATLTPIFGIWNPTLAIPFCAFDDTCELDETYCMSAENLSNTDVTNSDPDFNQVTLGENENFAIALQIQYDVLPLSGLLDFNGLTLNGKAVYTTKLPTDGDLGDFADPADAENPDECCCTAAALANDTNIIFVPSETTTIDVWGHPVVINYTPSECWKDYSPILDPANPEECEGLAGYEDPSDLTCDEECGVSTFSLSDLWSGDSEVSATCQYYATCNGISDISWLAFFTNIFSFFRETRDCWFGPTFFERLIQSIEKVHNTFDSAWDGSVDAAWDGWA
ncbi:MAG: hypothetical protein PF495_15435 [Spirochaetales bacterium]|jgi:hypothetical protein|nr:hypothetical protein [Spirochaetales bacterium]